jgi:hypothetical protein
MIQNTAEQTMGRQRWAVQQTYSNMEYLFLHCLEALFEQRFYASCASEGLLHDASYLQ